MDEEQRGLVPADGRRAGGRMMAPVGATKEIVVNGRRHFVEGDTVEHDQLVLLAFPEFRAAEGHALTVTYRGGPLSAPEGLLTRYQRTELAQGETFVVARTIAS